VPNRAHVRASAQSATQRADYVVQRNSRLVISSGAEKSLGGASLMLRLGTPLMVSLSNHPVVPAKARAQCATSLGNPLMVSLGTPLMVSLSNHPRHPLLSPSFPPLPVIPAKAGTTVGDPDP